MRTKKALFNTSSAAFLQIATVIVGFIIPILIIETYGSSINGLRASIIQFIGYLAIIEMGLGGALIYSLYKPLAKNNIQEVNSILAAAKRSYSEVGYYLIFLVAIMTVVYPLIIDINEVDTKEVMLLIVAIGSPVIINFFTVSKYKVLLTAAQDNYVLSIAQLLYLFINTIVILILINLKLSISLVYVASVFVNIIQISGIIFYAKRRFNYINFKVSPNKNATKKRFDVLIHQISGMTIMGTPVILLTVFTTLVDVSIYSIYALIFLGIGKILTVFNNGFSSGFGQIIALNDNKRLSEVYSQYEFLFYIILTFVFSCVTILGLSFIKIYTGGIKDANYVDVTLFILFIVVGVLNNVKIPQTTIITSAGHFKETRNRAIIEASITIVTSIVFINLFGLNGALIGSIIGLIYRSIDMLYAVKITQFPFEFTIIRLLRSLFISFLTILPFITIITINPQTIFNWLLHAILVAIWVLLIVLAFNFVFEKDVMKALIYRVKAIIKK